MVSIEGIFSKTADAVFAVNASREIVYVNNPLTRLCGQSQNELIGCHCYDAFKATNLRGDSFCGPDCPAAQSLEQKGAVKNFDLVLPKNDGLDEWVNVGALVAPPEWRPAHIIFTIRPFSIPKILGRFAKDKKKNTVQKLNGLTPRELQVVRKLAQGDKIPLIAEDLHICSTTVRNHINNIYQKLEIHSRAEVVSYAFNNNLI